MGAWDEICLICGGPIKNPLKKGFEVYNPKTDTIHKSPKTHKGSEWLEDLILITYDDKHINVKSNKYSDYGYFYHNNVKYIITSIGWKDIDGKKLSIAIMVHKKCYNLIKRELKYTIKFDDIVNILDKTNNLIKNKKVYGIASKYWGQMYDFFNVLKKDAWLLEMKVDNRKRIISGWKPLIKSFKEKTKRKSPTVSATIFDVGVVMKGNDNNKWIVSKTKNTKRWIPT